MALGRNFRKLIKNHLDTDTHKLYEKEKHLVYLNHKDSLSPRLCIYYTVDIVGLEPTTRPIFILKTLNLG